MEQSRPAAARKLADGPSLRRLVWWTFWFCLTALVLIRLPQEVSYWLLALAEKASLEGRTDEALAWVERAKEWTPESSLPIAMQAEILLRDKKSDPIALLDALLAKESTVKQKAALHLLKSDIYRTRDEYAAALREFDAAANLRGDLRPSQRRFELLLLAGDRDQARRELNQIAAQASEKGGSLPDNDMAYFSALLGDHLDDALKQVEKALAERPEEPAFLDTRGYILHRMGRNEEALADVQEAVETLEKAGAPSMGPQARKAFAVIVYHRSLIYDALGKSVEALQDRERVRELGFQPDERLF